MEFENYATIKNNNTFKDYPIKVWFNSYYNGDYYTVIDKQVLGKQIGKMIIENVGKEIINDDYECGYEQEIIFEFVEEITDVIRNEIGGFVLDYLDEKFMGVD